MELLEEYDNTFEVWVEGEDKDKINRSTKIGGNIFAYVIRNNVRKILKNEYDVSVVNAYIKGCNIEWDLLILKKGSKKDNDYNVYYPEQVVCALELKTSGFIYKKDEEKEKIQNFIQKYTEAINGINEKKNTNIKYGYISLCEKIDNIYLIKQNLKNRCFWVKEGPYNNTNVKINKKQDLEQFIKSLIK